MILAARAVVATDRLFEKIRHGYLTLYPSDYRVPVWPRPWLRGFDGSGPLARLGGVEKPKSANQ